MRNSPLCLQSAGCFRKRLSHSICRVCGSAIETATPRSELFLEEYELDDQILNRIARIIDEADTALEAQIEPAAPGLDLICLGLRRISRDDQETIDRGHLIYDALYAQLAAEPA
jgi:hypothetical protein